MAAFCVRYRTEFRASPVQYFFVSRDTVYTRTIRRAIEMLGSVEALSRMLSVPVAEIEAWADGRWDPPPAAFLTAIDIVAQSWSAPRHVAKS